MLFPIVGSHFVPPAKALLEHAPQGAAIVVRPERDNPYDSNAITVHITFGEIPASQHDELRIKLAGYGFDLDDCTAETEFALGHIAASGGKPIGKIEMTTGLSLAGTIELAALAGADWTEREGILQFANEGVPLVEIDYVEGENE
ncbi:hypothetical protein M0Q28_06135 [Patescibacteria group bacterium]|nr:hypothetical protein [Patescibacteria group bacterium]